MIEEGIKVNIILLVVDIMGMDITIHRVFNWFVCNFQLDSRDQGFLGMRISEVVVSKVIVVERSYDVNRGIFQ